ncbi:enterobactin exporter EntS [Planctomycetes bacterium K23_9]|uniref:Enterobactin exporter EntS n=2 Tax=Stieleria marina TaxID=1930275 RepID=A0A517P1P2_9BACT|nr:enterobactin exporter EntS [Planctomycetes bacterium K23_9]
MASLDSSPEMVAAVRTAMATPIVLLAIPAGVVADRVDRRQLLIITQLIMFATTATLATMTYTGVITSWMLLALTTVMGMALVLHVPTWQASIPELVPKHQMSRAVALGSISFNLARTAGPAVGGLLIATLGNWAPFVANALSFGGVLAVLIFWRREKTESSRGLSFRISLYQGVRYVARKSSMRNVMLGVAFFILPGSALWALLPLVAKQRLDWDANGFGLLVACVGGGALLASQTLYRLQSRFGSDRTVAGAMLVFAGGLFVMSQSTTGWVVAAATIVMGSGWMTTLTTLNATAQVTLPSQLRARGMSCYLTAMALSMSLGSFVWGQVAGWTDLSTAQSIAAATLVVTATISLRFKLGKSLV